MSSYLDRTHNSYVWNERNDLLGSGATSNVYKARCKRTGNTVAVKVYNDKFYRNPQLERELDILMKIDHRNVVKLIKDENSKGPRSHIVLMEYCNGSSLANIIEQPINYYGLPESEFLLVLQHITDGMFELNKLNIAHRDIKPNNILLQIQKNGEHLYKLTDFGTAKEFSHDQALTSIVGTEEYLFPDIYERAFKSPQGSTNAFKPGIDLWSIGVTLYHVATGQLPFRPIGGRRNRDTMIKIVKDKPTGMISGVEKSTNIIEYKADLPVTCTLSRELQKLLIPMLAGLIENDYTKMWTFQQFFDYSAKITSLNYVNFIDVRNYDLFEVALEPTAKLSDLKAAVIKNAEFDNNVHMLVCNNILLNIMMENTQLISTCPFVMNETNPLLLFDFKKQIDSNNKPESLKPLPNPRVNLPVKIQDAIDWCKRTLADFYDMQRKFTKYSMISELLKEAALPLMTRIGDFKAKQDIILHNLNSMAQNLETKSENFVRIYNCLRTVNPKPTDNYQEKIFDLKKLQSEIRQLEAQMNLFTVQYKGVADAGMELTVKGSLMSKQKLHLSRICDECQELYDEFLDEKKEMRTTQMRQPDSTLSPFGEFRCNKLDRILISEAYDLYNKDFLIYIKTFFTKYVNWLNNLIKFHNQINGLAKDLNECHKKLDDCKRKIDEDINNKMKTIVDYLTNQLINTPSSSHSKPSTDINNNNAAIGLASVLTPITPNSSQVNLPNKNQVSSFVTTPTMPQPYTRPMPNLIGFEKLLDQLNNNTGHNDVAHTAHEDLDECQSLVHSLNELKMEAQMFDKKLDENNGLLKILVKTVSEISE